MATLLDEIKMSNEVVQKNNSVGIGDIVGRDKITFVMSDEVIISPQTRTIRTDIDFDLKSDPNSTTLVMKLGKGGFASVFIDNAKRSKVKALSILIPLIKTESGKAVIADIYENLINVFHTKYFSQLAPGEVIKTNMTSIYNDLSALCIKYRSLLQIDEALLCGLLYLATSNCAIWWKNEE